MIGIYKITNPNKKVYIGQSVNIQKRFHTYKLMNCKRQTILYNSFLKYGIDKHKFEILYECNIEELNEKERYYQDLYSVLNGKGLNCRLTKSSDRSGKLSQEHKQKISLSNIGKLHSKESKLKMSLSHIGKKLSKEHKLKLFIANNGKARSEETKLKISKSSIGKKMSEESKIKMSLSSIGFKHSENTKLKMSLSSKGKLKSDTHKLNISKSKIGKKMSNESKLKLSKSKSKLILNLNTGIFYYGILECSIAYGINKNTLQLKLSGQIKNNTNFIYI